jgi:hypothetical protein
MRSQANASVVYTAFTGRLLFLRHNPLHDGATEAI